MKLSALLRTAWRSPAFLVLTLSALLEAAWISLTSTGPVSPRKQADWMRRWAAEMLSLMDVEVAWHGRPPVGGLLVCNHVSYLDIPVLTTTREMNFLSKSEVRHWPLIGWLARAGGTVFVNRSRRKEVARTGVEAVELIRSNCLLTMFPEGTSSDGKRVLPFHSALLEPAAILGWPVTPAHICYELDDAEPVDQAVAWWGDMTFLPHFLNLLGKRRVRAVIRFGTPLRDRDRKALALQLHDAVQMLAALDAQTTPPATSPVPTGHPLRGFPSRNPATSA